MRRILLIVAMLLLATAPAMATVTVRAIQNQPSNAIGQYTVAGRACNILDVNYTCDTEEVRAFALEVSVNNGFVISAVSDYKRGESNDTSPGYGIFPGSFRTALNPSDIDWVEPNYGPVASTSDPDAAGTGIGTNKVILEMGSLYVGEANKPASSGTLCRLTIDPCVACTPASCTVTFTVNALRGGVVLYDGSSVTPTVVGNGVTFSFPKAFPCWEPYRLQYNEWLSVWEPFCWSGQCANENWRTQCWGDADGKYQTGSRYRVYTSDYDMLIAAWSKKATVFRTGMGVDGNLMCADFDHKYQTGSRYRVYTSDYDRMIAAWAKKETVLRVAPFGWCPLP